MIIVFLLGVFTVGTLWELFYRLQWERDIFVRLWFDTDVVYAGQETKLYERIENRKRMPVPILEVGFHTRKELNFIDVENTNISDYLYKRDVFVVLGRQKITREIPVKCTKRGKYTASDADIATYTLLYRKRYSKKIQTTAEIYVYAKMTDVSQIITMCERMLGIQQCARRLYEDPFAFRTIRGYTTDDPMKTINWKASAKTGTLMVNTFDSVQSQKAMVFLDVEDTGILKYEELVEESIALAASVIRKLLNQNTEVGFVYNGNNGQIFEPSNNKRNSILFERLLAEFDKEDGVEPFGQLIQRSFDDTFLKRPLSEDTLLLFITKNLDCTLYNCISQYTEGRPVLIVVPVYRGEREARERVVKNFIDKDTKNKGNVYILVKEVER